MGYNGHPGGGGERCWHRMTSPSGYQPWTHAWQRWWRRTQIARGGSATPRSAPQSESCGGSVTCQRGRRERLIGWQENKTFDTCATPDNLNGVMEPTPPGGSTGKSYDNLFSEEVPSHPPPHPQMTEIPDELGVFILTSLINLWGYHEDQNSCSLRVARLLLTIDLYVRNC